MTSTRRPFANDTRTNERMRAEALEILAALEEGRGVTKQPTPMEPKANPDDEEGEKFEAAPLFVASQIFLSLSLSLFFSLPRFFPS